jgi:beta-xylosidase
MAAPAFSFSACACLLLLTRLLLEGAAPPPLVAPWVPDRGDGNYQNPVLHADYSDPDAVRVGDDYWLVSSSFSHVPGLPVLHSRDLVNWSLVAHALPRLVPEDIFLTPQHGNGVWAPAIRYHDGKFWIYYPDPDFGIYVVTATDPRGPWSAPVLVKAGKGLIDPCPLWDDDGKVWLIHGWAKSRAGINNMVSLQRLSDDGRQVMGDAKVIIDGNKLSGYNTLEGPKLYKRNGWYYIFAPAGGVATGWQSVFRARNITGPYEDRIVLGQGKTSVNGPHQGALVDTPSGEWWFLHFQDKAAYGRVVHLQPVVWHDDWPVIGDDPEGDGKGQPFLTHLKPALPPQPVTVPATSDEFESPELGLQWQWQANPQPGWFSLTARPGVLRLFAQPVMENNLYLAPHLLLQKFPAPEFTVTTKLSFAANAGGDSAGLIVFGCDYAWIGVRADGGQKPVLVVVKSANEKPVVDEMEFKGVQGPIYLQVTVRTGGLCHFAYSLDGSDFTTIGPEFKASVGRWVGANVGLFAMGQGKSFADFDWFHVAAVKP